MRYFLLSMCLATCLLLFACHKSEIKNGLVVGVMAGPEAQLMETAKQVAAKRYNLPIKIIQFNDYNAPNVALYSSDIDANIYQHSAFLEAAMKANGYEFTPIAKTFIYPMGIYSKKIKNLSELRQGAIVAIQNDPSNEGRALLLLQEAKLIQLKPNVGFTATPLDIISNPKKLVFQEIDAAQIPRILPDVDIATINTTYVGMAGLSPAKDALVLEGVNSPYANLIVVRTADKDNPLFVNLIKSYQSDEVAEKAQVLFKGDAVPAWKK